MNVRFFTIILFATLLIKPCTSTPHRAETSGVVDQPVTPHSNTHHSNKLSAFDHQRDKSGELEVDEESTRGQHFRQHTVVTKLMQPKSNPRGRSSNAKVATTGRENGSSTAAVHEDLTESYGNPTTSHAGVDTSSGFPISYDDEQLEHGTQNNTEDGSHHHQHHNHEQALDIEEQKLRVATIKLVKWLRNRLRKRLKDVAHLENDVTTENELLKNLREEIEDASRKREDEIKQKLQTRKELSDFRRHSNPPDVGIKRVQSQTKALSDQLDRLKEAYESMTARHRDLENKLRSAGFTHWLEARGREYFPDTAVGVLSKSAQILGPVTHGFQRALLFDDRLSTEMEQIIPGSGESILGKIVWDISMMVPFIPFLMLLRFANGMIRCLSVYDIVLCGSGLFTAESFLCLLMSVFFGREILGVCQEVNETILVALLFINSLAFLLLFLAQILISCLRPSRAEAVQVILLFTAGCRYYQYVFRPVMLTKPVMITIMSHILYVITFSLIFVEKKRALNFKTPYDAYFKKTTIFVKTWIFDTAHAMRNMFSDSIPYGSRTFTGSGFGSRSSFCISMSNVDINSESHEQIATDTVEPLESKHTPRSEPSTEYPGQNRWYPVNRSASLIRKTFTACQQYGDRMNLGATGSIKQGRAPKKSSSYSDDSVAYQSCME